MNSRYIGLLGMWCYVYAAMFIIQLDMELFVGV